MAVVDCFTFFNEIDLLKFRLEYLKDVVDYHVIVESNLTFSGNKKPYNLKERLDEFEEYKNKIIYFQVEQSTHNIVFLPVESYTPTNGSFLLEYQQRNGISYASNYVKDSDLVLISDLDEIPSREAIKILDASIEENDMISLSMLFHYYYMNCQNTGFERFWNGTVAVRGKGFKLSSPQNFRDLRNHLQHLPNAGYHFSFLGGVEKIRTKIQSFAHTEFNRPDIVSEENIAAAIKKGEDVFKRPGVSYKFVDIEQYPEDIKAVMKKYPQFIKQL